jgi:hypothetical protein
MIAPVIITIVITARENGRHERCENYRGHKRSLLRRVHNFFLLSSYVLIKRNSHANLVRLEKHGITQPLAWNFPENHSSELVDTGQ